MSFCIRVSLFELDNLLFILGRGMLNRPTLAAILIKRLNSIAHRESSRRDVVSCKLGLEHQ